MTSLRQIALPGAYEEKIESALRRIGYTLSQPHKIAQAVKKLSDHYTQNPEEPTPWLDDWAQAASIAYYFPLNYARNKAVALEAKRLGFLIGLEEIHDLGSGMGSAIHAWMDEFNFPENFKLTAVDISSDALALGRSLALEGSKTYETRQSRLLNSQKSELNTKRPETDSFAILASYFLTELDAAPSWWSSAEAVVIVEPSTQADARRLMSFRQELIDQGFSIWAPCTHMHHCPLLTKSEKDWCHDRIHFSAPPWFLEIEKNLPMKNRTLTFSYLLARRAQKPPASLARLARLTGDMLEEKGKTRQSVCRGPEREFLSWFPQRLKKGQELKLQRGNLIFLIGEPEKKASEIRIKAPEEVRELSFDETLSSETK